MAHTALVSRNLTLTHAWLQNSTNTSISRFAYPECNETRSWKDLAQTYKREADRPMFMSGSMGSAATADFKAWACFKGHACLYKVAPTAYTDAMCFKYHEKERTWHPWALRSELHECVV